MVLGIIEHRKQFLENDKPLTCMLKSCGSHVSNFRLNATDLSSILSNSQS